MHALRQHRQRMDVDQSNAMRVVKPCRHAIHIYIYINPQNANEERSKNFVYTYIYIYKGATNLTSPTTIWIRSKPKPSSTAMVYSRSLFTFIYTQHFGPPIIIYIYKISVNCLSRLSSRARRCPPCLIWRRHYM